MPVETGNLSRIAYIAETTFGSTPATPVGQTIRQKSYALDAERTYIDNTELRIDSMVPAGRGGVLRGKGSIDGLLSYGTYDDFIAASLGNAAWTSNVVKIKPVVVDSATTLQMTASTKTLTRTVGSFITDGFVVGDSVNVGGFTNAGNNGQAIVNTVAALTMILTTSATLVDEAANAAASVSVNMRPSFTIERQHLANSMYFPFLGVVVNGFELSGKVSQAVELKLDLLTKGVGTESSSSVFTSITAANSNPIITSWDGSITKGGATQASIVGWTVKVTRNFDTAEVVGSSVIYDLQPKAAHVTGSMELYFADYSLYTAMRSETDLDVVINLGPGVTKSYAMELTAVRVKTWKTVPKDGLMTATVEFESFAPSAGSNTSFMLTRLP